MINQTTVHLLFSTGYGIVVVLMLLASQLLQGLSRKRYYFLLLVPSSAFTSLVLQAIGIRGIMINSALIPVPLIVADLIAYVVVFATILDIADVSRRTFRKVLAVVVSLRLLFVISQPIGQSLKPVVLGLMLCGYGMLFYLFLGRVWQSASSQPPLVRLLHWNSRNIALLLLLMLMTTGILDSVIITHDVIAQLQGQYPNFIFRGLLPAYLLYELESIRAGADQAQSTDIVNS